MLKLLIVIAAFLLVGILLAGLLGLPGLKLVDIFFGTNILKCDASEVLLIAFVSYMGLSILPTAK